MRPTAITVPGIPKGRERTTSNSLLPQNFFLERRYAAATPIITTMPAAVRDIRMLLMKGSKRWGSPNNRRTLSTVNDVGNIWYVHEPSLMNDRTTMVTTGRAKRTVSKKVTRENNYFREPSVNNIRTPDTPLRTHAMPMRILPPPQQKKDAYRNN